MYVFYDSQGIIQSIALADKPLNGFVSPFEGLTELFLDDTEYADVAKEPLWYKMVSNVPVKQTQPVTVPAQPPTTEQRLAALEAAIATLMGV